jgi:transposase
MAVYEELKLLNQQYLHNMQLLIRGKLSLTNLLDRTMPGIKNFLKSNNADIQKDKLCDFVEKFWHYDNITKLSNNKFTISYQKWAKVKGYHQSETKASQIYALSQTSIPTLSSSIPSTKMLILDSVRVGKDTS